jgi:CRISPR-associated protein Csm4
MCAPTHSQTGRISLRPLTAFGTPLVGDTLFGQLCWTLRRRHGEARLEALLEGYTEARPFAVVSDALPAGFLPLPTLPSTFWRKNEAEDRKALKGKHWLNTEHLGLELPEWQSSARNDEEAYGEAPLSAMQPHNAINRLTGTTGADGGFAPYASPQRWYGAEARLDVYIVLDEERLTWAELLAALADIGAGGYGRDASAGLGKFELEPAAAPANPAWGDGLQPGRHWLTLANCAPQGLGYDPENSYYQITTRFGRHGDVAALGGQPFKQPLLMAKLGAVFTLPEPDARRYLGQGLGHVSKSDDRAVHQGYAPVVPLPTLTAA